MLSRLGGSLRLKRVLRGRERSQKETEVMRNGRRR